MSPTTLANKYRKLFKEKNPNIKTAHTDKGHFYVSGEEKYHSVTYYTSFIKDPALSNWKMNRAVDFIANELYNEKWKSPQELWEAAKSAPEGEFSNAGSIGTQTHEWRQQFFQAWIDMGLGQLPDAEIDAWPLPTGADPEVISGCRAIKRFLKETGYIPVACELALVDDELKVGGTIDDLGVFPNPIKEVYTKPSNPLDGGYHVKYEPYLGFVDLKTSNQGKKPAYAYQVRGFYQRMIHKTFNIRPKKTYILHTSKEDGTYKLIDLTDMKFLEREVKFLVYASQAWDKVVTAFKPKVITI